MLAVVILGMAIGFLMPVQPPAPVAAAPATTAVLRQRPPEPPQETVIERQDGHFVATAEVNGQPVRFLVDTGADTVALTQEDAQRAGIAFDPALFTVIGQGAAGEVRGQRVTIDQLSLDGKRAQRVGAVVLEGSSLSLLGHSYLRELRSVSIEGDTMRLR
ncbi:MAG: TIGR02281 family clan AA aspartic protease [Sphingomonas sp.]|nr:TIGR02281 family clan AA aspartic protease [Sphingomonas sp.]